MHLWHSATHTAVKVLSLHPPPLLKGQSSSPCQMEFIHSRSPTNVILTKLTVRVGECRALVKITSPRFLFFSFLNAEVPPPTSPSGCISSFHVSFCYTLSINILYACTQAIMDFFIVHPPVCISDLLAGEEKKACDEIFLKSSHYLDSELSLSGSAAHYLIAHRNSLMLPVEIGLPDAVHMKKKLRWGEEEESVAINIASLHRLFKIL